MGRDGTKGHRDSDGRKREEKRESKVEKAAARSADDLCLRGFSHWLLTFCVFCCVCFSDRHDEDSDQYPEEAPRARSMLCMELKDCNGMPFAVIQIFNKRSPPVAGKIAIDGTCSFTEQDEAMLALLCLQAASVLRCCDLHLRNCLSKGYVDQLRKYDRVEIERLVKACSDEVFVGPWESEEKLVLAAAAKIKASINAQHCTLFLKQEDGQLGTPLVGKGGKFESVRVQVSDDTTAGWCAGHGEVVNVKNLALDERFNSGMSDEDERQAAMACSIMCVPILKSIDDAGCSAGVLGVIEVGPTSPHPPHCTLTSAPSEPQRPRPRPLASPPSLAQPEQRCFLDDGHPRAASIVSPKP